MNLIRYDDDSALHCAQLRDILKLTYINEVTNYFSNLNQEVDWSGFILAQMQVLLDTVNIKNFDKNDIFIALNVFLNSKTKFDLDLEIAGLELSAKNNSPDALYRLADLYENGSRIEKNVTKVVEYLERAVELNSSEAMNRLGIMYTDGIDITKDLKKAFHYFQLSAKTGDTHGQYNLGKFYDKYDFSEISNDEFLQDEFTGVRKKALSRVWIMLAAEQGLANAQHDVAVGYHIGESSAIDYKLALFWYQLAAAQGFLDSINNLGELFLNGHGVNKDLVSAYKWFNIASANNDLDALESITSLERVLSASEIEEALVHKQNWLSLHPIAKKNIYGSV